MITKKKTKNNINILEIPPYRVHIDIEGMDIHINCIKMNFIQRFILRLLGIKIEKLKRSGK